MCTFKDEQTVMVYDVAISQVRGCLHETFGETIQYTTVDGTSRLRRTHLVK
jgi:hypothetical protein